MGVLIKIKKKNLKAIHSFLTFCTQIPAALNAAKKTEKPAALPKLTPSSETAKAHKGQDLIYHFPDTSFSL